MIARNLFLCSCREFWATQISPVLLPTSQPTPSYPAPSCRTLLPREGTPWSRAAKVLVPGVKNVENVFLKTQHNIRWSDAAELLPVKLCFRGIMGQMGFLWSTFVQRNHCFLVEKSFLNAAVCMKIGLEDSFSEICPFLSHFQKTP